MSSSSRWLPPHRSLSPQHLAFAFVIYVPLAALYINLRTAPGIWTPRLDPPDILLTPALLAALGILLAWRRLQ